MNLHSRLFVFTLLLAATASTNAWAVDKIRIEHRPSRNDVNTQLADSWLSLQQGELLVALMQYRGVLRSDARNRDALLGLANVALRQHDDHLAANYFARALALDPRDPEAHAGLALLNNEASHESSLKLLLGQHPDNAALYFALGKLYGEQSRWSEARNAFERAHLLAPNEASPLLNLAICLDHLNQLHTAAETYRQALALDKSERAFDHAAITLRLQQLNPERHDTH